MFDDVLNDIIGYIDFLGRVGYTLSLGEIDRAFEPVMSVLCGYTDEPSAPVLSVTLSHEDKTLATVCVAGASDERELSAMCAPLAYMFERLYERCCEYRSHATHETVADAYERSLLYIRDHYTEGISVADVARCTGYSVSYFGYIFKKNRGISANKYITDLQLAKAAELLSATSLSVSDVAERVGFGDANYFSTSFKAQYGLSPRQYRKDKKT